MRLLLVELRRLGSRRLVRLTVVLAFLSVLLVDGVIAVRSDKDIAGARATASRVEQQQYRDCLAFAAAHPGATDGPSRADCDQQRPTAQARACLARAAEGHAPADECARIRDMYLNDPRFHLADHVRDLLTGTTTILMAVAVVLGASALGAEWQSGTFASLLTWEPRRQRVLAAKLVAPVVVTTAMTAVILPLITAGAWLAADLRGTTTGTTSHVWALAAAEYGRAVGLIALVTLIAGGLAALTRHTVAAVGIVGGYLVAGEVVGGIVSAWWRQHGLAAHLVAFMRGTWSYSTPVLTPAGEQLQVRTLHAAGGALVVSALAAVAVAAAATLLARSDVS
jgi:ABC-2 type transport system permease protein